MTPPLLLEQNRKLSELTTLGIGGEARYFVEVKDIDHMQQVMHFCQTNRLPYFILGKGSNCFFDDQGFSGVVIGNRIAFFNSSSDGIFHVGAGYSFSLLGVQTARQGWSGLEFASGIPGSVGGAVYMNAGANGLETCQCLISVDFMTEDGTLQVISRAELEFGYRYSPFQNKKGVIIGATFSLSPSTTARSKQLSIIDYRKKTQPYHEKSAGCMFRNPSATLSAGALIDQLGLKGASIGEAAVSTLHGNFFINQGQASAKDMLTLIETIKKEVKDQKGIELESEVRYVPYFELTSEKDVC